MSVLYADLVNYTAVAERLDPEDVQSFLKFYQATVRRKVDGFGGSVERIVGDGVVAVFGVPRVHEDDPERAIRAAIGIIEALRSGNEARAFDLPVRIAINTGEVLVWAGVDAREGNLVTGDVVNTAARLQELAPSDGIVVGENTYKAARAAIDFAGMGTTKVKGKSAPVRLWRVVAPRSRTRIESNPPKAPFFGRGHELEVLKRTFARTVEESSVQLATVVGEPGAGKSRLIAELSAYVASLENVVQWRQGRCLPYGEGITFWALGEIVKTHAGILESDDPDEAAWKLRIAVRRMPGSSSEWDWLEDRLAPLVGVAARSAGPVDREEMFAAWRKFLEGIATAGPLVLVLEDLHWADPALLEFVEHLVDWASGVPVLVAATARPELFGRFPEWGSGKRNSTTIRLGPLTDEETAGLLSALLSGSVLPPAIQSLLLEAAGGNPLYAEEFVGMLEDRALIEYRGRTLWLDLETELEFPDTLQAIIAARLDTLTPEHKALLQDAAVVGKVFWSGALAAMSQIDSVTLPERLHELIRKNLIRPAPASSVKGQAEYSFGHVLTRDVAYAQIPRSARVVKHVAAASWVEALAGHRVADHAELLAHHYGEALSLARAGDEAELVGGLEQATRRNLILAGDRAMRLDVGRADFFYQRALGLLPEQDPERPSVLTKAGMAAHQTGDFARAKDLLEKAVAGHKAQGDWRAAADAMISLTRVDYALTDALLPEAIRILESDAPSPELVRAYAVMAMEVAIEGRFGSGKAIEWADRALETAEGLDVPEQRSMALMARGGSRCYTGDPGGLDDLHGALQIAERLGLARMSGTIHNNLGDVLWRMEGPSRALQSFRAALKVAQQSGLREVEMSTHVSSLQPLFDQGKWNEVLQVGEAVNRWARTEGHDYHLAQVLPYQARVRSFRGEVGEAQELAAVLLPLARGFGDAQVLSDALPAVAVISAAGGDIDGAIRLVELFHEATRDPEDWFRLDWLADIVRVCVIGARIDMAEQLTTRALPSAARPRLMLLTATAVVQEARGELIEATNRYEEASEGWESLEVVLEQGQSCLGAGRCLVRLGRTSEAIPFFTKARTIFQRLRARILLEDADRALEKVRPNGS